MVYKEFHFIEACSMMQKNKIGSLQTRLRSCDTRGINPQFKESIGGENLSSSLFFVLMGFGHVSTIYKRYV